jgi:hypothetical protein
MGRGNPARVLKKLRTARANRPREKLWVAQAMQPVRRRVRKTHEHRAASGRGDAMFGRLPQNFRAEGVGQNEPRVIRHDFDGHAFGNREEQPVAMGAIVVPFCVGAEIRDGGFDFDDKDRGVGCERDDVGTPPREQRQFGDGRKG